MFRVQGHNLIHKLSATSGACFPAKVLATSACKVEAACANAKGMSSVSGCHAVANSPWLPPPLLGMMQSTAQI